MKHLQKLLFSLFACAVCWPPANAHGYEKIPPHDLQFYAEKSEIVAHVRIVEAQLVFVEEQDCGAAYKAQVIEAYKGKVGSVEFFSAKRLDLGEEYVAFLTGEEGAIYPDLALDTPLHTDASRVECNSVYPPYSYHSRVSGPVTWLANDSRKSRIDPVNSSWVVLPSGLIEPEGIEVRRIQPLIFKVDDEDVDVRENNGWRVVPYKMRNGQRIARLDDMVHLIKEAIANQNPVDHH